MSATHESAFGSIPIFLAACLLLAAQPVDRTSPGRGSLANSSQEGIYTSQQKITRRYVDANGTVREPSGYSLIWERLEALSLAERENAVIRLETGKEVSASQSSAIENAESLWSIGLFEEAIEAIRALEESGVHVAVGVNWKIPIEAGTVSWTGADVRIGSQTGIKETHLDFDAQNGNLFAVLRYANGSFPTTRYWSVNISTDNGQTWQETYQWSGDSEIRDVSAVVVDDYLYVGYVVTSAIDEARMRRCLVSDGSIDSAYSWETVIDKNTPIEEIALASNADSADTQVYYFAILSDHRLIFYVAPATSPVWWEEPTGVTNAGWGLDATYHERVVGSNPILYTSYIASDGANPVVVLRRRTGGDWEAIEILPAYTGSLGGTSISAYDETVVCAYKHSYSNGNGIRYNVSYDGGDSWLWGSWEPDPGHSFRYPDVTCRGGLGSAIVFNDEAGDFDSVWFRYRDHYSPGDWDAVVAQINEYEGASAWPSRVEWLPPLAGHAYAYGTIYISSEPDPMWIPYFDRMMPLIFEDTFESGDTSAWSSTVP